MDRPCAASPGTSAEAPDSRVRRLVIAPHMDDESLGCGGLLAKFADTSLVLTMTDSGPVRSAEQAAALAVLGITQFVNLDFEDGTLPQQMRAVVGAIDRAMADFKPHEVYLPFPSLHQDHIATYEAGMRSARISMSSDHWFPPSVLVYDISVYDVNLYPTDLRWNVFEPLADGHVQAKQDACDQYKSEIPSELHPITSIREIAAAVGRPRLLEYAEQFALVRNVRP